MTDESQHTIVVLRPAPREVRFWGRLDTFLYNLMAMNVAMMMPLPLLAAAAFYPEGSLAWALLIAGVFCCFEAVVYAFLASSFPRSGGDYYFQSRLLSQSSAAVVSLAGLVIGEAVWMAIAAWAAAFLAVGPLCVIGGDLLNVGMLFDLGVAVQSGTGMFVLGVLVVAWSTVVNVWGLGVYALLQRLSWIMGAVAVVVLVVLLVVFGAGGLGSSDRYDEAVSAVAQMDSSIGMGATGFWAATLALLPVAAFSLIYPGWSVQQGGQLQQAASLRTQLFTILAAESVTIGLSIAVAVGVLDVLGGDGLAAGARLFFFAPDTMPYPTVPFFWFFDGSLWPSGVAALCLVVAFNAWFWMWVPDMTMAASRVLARIAGDRVLPGWLADVREPSGAPMNAVLVFHAVCLLPIGLFAYQGVWRSAFAATLISILAFAVTCGAAAVLPFSRRELYRGSSAASFDFARVPIITLCGASFVIFSLLMVWRFLVDDALALGGSHAWLLASLPLAAVSSWAVCAAYRRYQRRRRRLEIEITYRRL
jgi:amino acid transporter